MTQAPSTADDTLMMSCAPDIIYAGMECPAAIVSGIDPINHHRTGERLSTIAQLFAGSRYHWRATNDIFAGDVAFGSFLREFYGSMPVRRCPTSVLVRMENVTLIGGVLYSHGREGNRIIYETCRPVDHEVIWMAPADRIAAANRKMFAVNGWRSFYLGSAGSFNYGHWLVDDLPRLKGIFHMMALDPGPIRVVIESFGTEIDRVRIESIRMLLAQPFHVDIVARHEAYHFGTLYYPTPISEHPVVKSPVALDFLVQRAIETAGFGLADRGRANRLFVDRSAAHGRTLTNGDAVRALMVRRGFAVIDPEGKSFAEQVRLFAGASIVIGQMGAAMTNTVFCRPTTTTLYLAPVGWIEPFYFDLAMTRGHDYRVIYGPVTDPDVPPHQSDFTVAIDELEALLDSLDTPLS